MKAKFFFLGLCALALAACSIDEVSQVNDSNAIQFRATATRATAATTNSIDDFTVWAWEGANVFMDGVYASRVSEGSNTYSTSHTYYWPGATLDFYAFIPAATVETVDEVEYAYFGDKIDMTGDKIEGEVTPEFPDYVATATISGSSAISFDVCVPEAAADEIDLGYAATLGKSSGTVALNFRHALTQVAFKAQNGNADWTVDIQGVTLCGIYKEGTYTLPEFGTDGTTVHNASDAERGTWAIEEGAVQGRFEAGIAAVELGGSESQSITAEDGALMLIPQQVAAWDPLTDPTNTNVGAYISINCKVMEGDDQLWPNYHELDENNERLEYADITVPFDVNWEEGYLYTYTIVFGEGLGYYAPDDEVAGAEYEGTPVLIPIRFTVDIDDFGNVDETADTEVDLSYIKVESADELAGAVRMGYQTIEIAKDITLDHYLLIDHDCTIILDNGTTLTGPDGDEDYHIEWEEVDGYDDYYYTAIIFVNGGNLTINGEGTVTTGGSNSSDYTSAIFVENGSVTVNGGTYKGSNWQGNTSDLYTRSAVYCSTNGYAYIYGGDFYAGPSERSASRDYDHGYHWVLNVKNSAYKEGNAMIYCYGGTYHDDFDPASPHTDDAPSYVAAGYWSVKSETANSDGLYSYTVEAVPTSPVSVSTAENLRDAVAAGASAITVTADVDLLGYLEFNSDCTLTIEDGVTITCPNADNGDNAIDHNGDGGTVYSAAIYVNGCNVTIEGSGTVTTDGTADACYTNAIWVVNGKVTVNGGTFKGSCWNYDPASAGVTSWSKHAVYCGENGYAYLNGGSFSCGYTYVSYATSENGYWVLNCHNSSELSGHAMIYCTGGKYLNFDPSNPGTDDAISYVVEGYKVTSEEVTGEGTWYTVEQDI